MSSNIQPIYFNATVYKQGLGISVASNTTLTIASGVARSIADDADLNLGDFFGYSASPQANTTLNAAVNGVNGLDTGTLAASTVYNVFVIGDLAGYNPTATLLSLSQTAPLLPSSASAGIFPSGYNTFRHIGFAVTNASTQFIVMLQSGIGSVVYYKFNVPIEVLTAGTSATQAAVDLSAVVPAVNGIPVLLGCDFAANAAGDTAKLCYSGGTIASSHDIITGQVAGSTAHMTPSMMIPAAVVSGKAKIDYILSTASASLSLWVTGFVDLLA